MWAISIVNHRIQRSKGFSVQKSYATSMKIFIGQGQFGANLFRTNDTMLVGLTSSGWLSDCLPMTVYFQCRPIRLFANYGFLSGEHIGEPSLLFL